MSVYAIGDLHLSFEVDKPMDIFGGRWQNYEEKLATNWKNTVSDDDIVIIPGDVSWATYLAQARKDFLFIDQLPGRKIIVKGNHDYWWETVKKMNDFLQSNNCTTIEFLHNNAIELDNCVLVGTKGYAFDEKEEKIINREIERFRLSLQKVTAKGKQKIAIFHYPPMHSDKLMAILDEEEIEKVIYGHIHGEQTKYITTTDRLLLVSADYLHFQPVKICE